VIARLAVAAVIVLALWHFPPSHAYLVRALHAAQQQVHHFTQQPRFQRDLHNLQHRSTPG